MFEQMVEDIETAYEKDPAARSFGQVAFLYPGLHAVWMYRISHRLWESGFKFMARLISRFASFLTGIEIHPAAEIGERFFIDHGEGVVIGETAEIGDDVLMYQGVTLGGTSKDETKRHPTIGDNVVIGAGAVLLGPIEIGRGSRVGAQSVVLESVPPETTVIGVPGRPVKREAERKEIDLDHADMPDPIASVLERLLRRQEELEDEIDRLRSLTSRRAETEA